MGEDNKSRSKRYFRIAFLLFLPVWILCAYNVIRQIQRLEELEKLIPKRVHEHNTWTAARRAEVKSLEEKASNAKTDRRDRLTEESKAARTALDEAVKADQDEILELWNEAHNSRSHLPRPEFTDD